MKIGFDGKRAVNNMTGLGNYSRLIIESMAKSYPDDEMCVYTPTLRENPRILHWKKYPNIAMLTPADNELRLGKAMWRSMGITSRLATDKIDIFHGLSNELPLNISKSGIPSVVTVHDIIYRRLPKCYSTIDRKIYDFKYGRSCHNATKIIAISECTKRDIMHYYGVEEEKIEVIYQGCDEAFKQLRSADDIAATCQRHGLPRRYLVQIGTIEERKNALLSVRALSALSDPTVHLLLIGRGTHYLNKVLKEAETLGVADRVDVRSNIPFADLPYILQGAKLALYPSRYEGFGLPVLEAISGGKPVIAATGSCLEEAGGDGAIYVNPDSAREMCQAIEHLMSHPHAVAELRAKGLAHCEKFSNSDVAGNTHNLYESLLRH